MQKRNVIRTFVAINPGGRVADDVGILRRLNFLERYGRMTEKLGHVNRSLGGAWTHLKRHHDI